MRVTIVVSKDSGASETPVSIFIKTAPRSLQKPVNVYQSTRRNSPEDSTTATQPSNPQSSQYAYDNIPEGERQIHHLSHWYFQYFSYYIHEHRCTANSTKIRILSHPYC